VTIPFASRHPFLSRPLPPSLPACLSQQIIVYLLLASRQITLLIDRYLRASEESLSRVVKLVYLEAVPRGARGEECHVMID